MISSAKTSPASSGGTAATGANSANAASPVSAGNAPTDTVASPFDSILTLESLAASCNALGPKLLGDGHDGVAGSGLAASDDTDVDAADGADAEDPLAFLASLLNVAAATPPPQTSSGAGACTDDAAGDMLSGHARKVAVPIADNPISLFPQDTSADTGVAGVAGKAGDVADAATAQKLLSAMVPVAAADPNAARSDAAQSTDAVTAGLARAAEMLGHGPRHAAAPSRDTIPTPVRDPQWAQDFSARVSLMVRGGESTASLQLSPIDLGPVDVNVVVRDSQATVHFGAAQAETRALIEASIPRLREMLAAQGFNLMDASVSQGFARQARAEVRSPLRHDSEPDVEVHATTSIAALGLLDTYA